MSPVDVQELRRLVAAGTPGPWHASTRHLRHYVWSPHRGIDVVAPRYDDGALDGSDAELMCALVNAAPALLDDLEALRAEMAQAQTALSLAGFGGTLVEQCGRVGAGAGVGGRRRVC